MHLRSVTIKGFKSFPDRTRLEFAPGVSVIVGPNGSGKSNVCDAVLWALGEQSPLTVRGQSMQDVIFAGGRGRGSREAAEVEVVIDNAGGAFERELGELSIVRRLERSGEGEYRLNGTRCRLVDVLEALSDTGLGKETHSVVSQGRVEAIVHSRPRDRRLLIEEAAGLGKHRKRRRQAQRRLERTEQNLARALDVEREARSRLRPLKRRAEAAELHERLERQALEARAELARDAVREVRDSLAGAESEAAAARAARAEDERRLATVVARRQEEEAALAERTRAREALSSALYAARSATERIGLRLERASEIARAASERREQAAAGLERLAAADTGTKPAPDAPPERVAVLERELSELDAQHEAELAAELAALIAEAEAGRERRARAEAETEARRAALRAAERSADDARGRRRDADRAIEADRREAARAGAELAAVNRFLSGTGSVDRRPGAVASLAELLGAEPGYELALAAALGPRLRAGLAADLGEGEELLDRAGASGGTVLLARSQATAGPRKAPTLPSPPLAGATPLLEHVAPDAEARPLVERLLAETWVVDSLAGLTSGAAGVFVTRSGRALFAATAELHQAPAGGDERVLAELRRREEMIAASAEAARAERVAQETAEDAEAGVARADAGRDAAGAALRVAARELEEATEALRRAERLLARRREAPEEGSAGLRRAELAAELRAERRLVERAEHERAERERRRRGLKTRIDRAEALRATAERAAAALGVAQAAAVGRRDHLGAALEADEALVQGNAAELRACAHEEAELQARLRRSSEEVTAAEVRAQRARDAAADAEADLERLADRLEAGAATRAPRAEPLSDALRAELEAKIRRIDRRRELLGPFNPLAPSEYEEALDHAGELEAQRRDLEAALAELEGLIRDTDRQIRESFESTFEETAKNFEEVVSHLFPGGRGRLRLAAHAGPRAVRSANVAGPASDETAEQAVDPSELDTASAAEPGAAEPGAAEPLATGPGTAEPGAAGPREDDPAVEDTPPEEPGVEVEVTPAGKATRRLSLLSGGEKSLVALAFLFAVFLARPCPFYLLDEVEAALDDANIDRFLELLRRYSERAQFIVVTHQKRTMDAADRVYGVSMGDDGVSKVLSRRLRLAPPALEALDERGAA